MLVPAVSRCLVTGRGIRGVLPWAIGLLALTAWITVLQRILHVRRELSTR